jgi:hypothetical protein
MLLRLWTIARGRGEDYGPVDLLQASSETSASPNAF